MRASGPRVMGIDHECVGSTVLLTGLASLHCISGDVRIMMKRLGMIKLGVVLLRCW